MQRPVKTYRLMIFIASIIICLPLLFFAYSYLFSAGRSLANATATTAATPIPSLDAQTIGNMTAVLYSDHITSGSIGVIVAISGWKENYYIENVWFQSLDEDPVRMNGTLVSTRINESGYMAQVEFVPLKELPSERLQGEVVLQISRHLGSQFAEFKLHLDLELPDWAIFDVMQTVNSNGVEVILQSIEAASSTTVVNLCFTKPSSAEWNLGNVTLKTNVTSAVKIDEYLLFDSGLNKGVLPDWAPTGFLGRCERIMFPPVQITGTTEMILTIDNLNQPVPEQLVDTEVRKIAPELGLYGIELAFRPIPESENGAGAREITKKPAGMDDPAVWHVVYTALGYYRQGPWIFRIAPTFQSQ
jgi:hypothetical protein